MSQEIKLSNVVVRAKGREILNIVNLRIPPGRTALLGLNGSGKSTLLRALAHPNTVQAGEISGLPEVGIAYLPQHFSFPKNFTLFEMLTYVGWLRGLSSSIAARRAKELAVAGDLEAELSHRLSALSGGMLQRAAILQSLTAEPNLLLLDEPTVGVDLVHQNKIRELMHSLPARVLVFSTHSLKDAIDVAENVIILNEGRVAYSGILEDILPAATISEEASSRALLKLLAEIPERNNK